MPFFHSKFPLSVKFSKLTFLIIYPINFNCPFLSLIIRLFSPYWMTRYTVYTLLILEDLRVLACIEDHLLQSSYVTCASNLEQTETYI